MNILPKFELPPPPASTSFSHTEINAEFKNVSVDPVPLKYKYHLRPALDLYKKSDLEMPTPFGSTYFGELKNQRIHAQLKVKNSDLTVYDVNYVFNTEGFRQVQDKSKTKKNNSQFVIAAGCSFTFGQGVDQGFDYPSQLSEKLGPDWSVYNYGQIGGSPNEFLYSTENYQPYLTQIKQSEGVFIWLFISHQMKRMICPVSCYREMNDRFILEKPDYTLDNGQLIHHGKINEGNRFIRKLYKILAYSKTIEYFKSDFPHIYSNDSYKLFFSTLNQSIFNIEKTGKKIIVIYSNSEHNENLIKQAKLSGFEIINFQKLRDYRRDVNFVLQIDLHPSSEAYWLLSEAIKNNLQKDVKN